MSIFIFSKINEVAEKSQNHVRSLYETEKMIGIFVSHSWGEDAIYQRFVAMLDEVIGNDGWNNLSIPWSAPLDILSPREWYLEEKLQRLEDQLIRVEAELRNPDLPDAIERIVWDEQGQRRNVPTVASVRKERNRLLNEMSELVVDRAKEREQFLDLKDASKHIRVHPVLSIAIRNRIKQAQLVFVLLSRWREIKYQ